VGSRLQGDCVCEDPGLYGGLLGAIAGVSVMIPVSVHLTNDSSGRLKTALQRSLVLGGIGLGLSIAGGRSAIPFVVLLAVPPIQLLTSIHAERETQQE
jgi:hypothetical protein